MTKLELIDLLMDDFKKMFPNADEATRKHVRSTLERLKASDLELMASGIDNN